MASLLSEKPIFFKLNTLIFQDLITLHCFKLYYKFYNNVLPKYFYDEKVIVKSATYTHRYTLRTNMSASFPGYITEEVNHRPDFLVPKTKTASSQKRLYYQLPCLLNTSTLPQNVLKKVDTHSLQGCSLYYKKITITKYNVPCEIANCIICAMSD